ncbi:hypothetical protein FHS43_004609 [Streptosporangium becharense]|uniref:Uncharacterized protein n=1 Tax=Streptosporangium becharense TaxID=1816182 RepID=A0A7W9ILG4_9ACTN|nr:ALQxL family class IV lanthipeptide [Streptosporangium becharense]MBB2913311.1 hypothetical protein [Streptosporangium becharense]MBB5822294.1 hypothetical protein [Streptosporangium becharense]
MEIDIAALDMLPASEESQLQPCFGTCFDWTRCVTTYVW